MRKWWSTLGFWERPDEKHGMFFSGRKSGFPAKSSKLLIIFDGNNPMVWGNSVPLNPMVNDHYPYEMAIIGNIPYFQTNPYWESTCALNQGLRLSPLLLSDKNLGTNLENDCGESKFWPFRISPEMGYGCPPKTFIFWFANATWCAPIAIWNVVVEVPSLFRQN